MIAMSSRIDPLSIYYAPLKSKITFLALVSTINTATPASFWLVYRIYRTFPSCMTWTHWTKFFTISLPLSPWQPPDGEIWTLVHHLWEFKMQPLCKTIRRFFKKKIQNRTIIPSSDPISGHLSRRTEVRILKKYFHFHWSIIHNS